MYYLPDIRKYLYFYLYNSYSVRILAGYAPYMYEENMYIYSQESSLVGIQPHMYLAAFHADLSLYVVINMGEG